MTKDEFLSLLNQLIDAKEKIICLFAIKTRNDVKNEIKEKYKGNTFEYEYNNWYSQSLIIVKHFLSYRFEEFELMYKPAKNRKELTLMNYTIYDAICGLNVKSRNIYPHTATSKLITQFGILESIKTIVDNKLDEMNSMLEFDIFEKELDAARHLLKNKYYRSAGAICGVIIEKHLTNILNNNNILITKKNPGINDLNSLLYENQLIDSTKFKFITFLADIRNKCDHNKDVEPTKEEIHDLIEGTQKIIKTYN